MRNQIMLFAILFVSVINVYAEHNPVASAVDNRIKIVAYRPNDVVTLHMTTFVATQILLGENEVVKNIQGGDVSAWSVTVPKNLSDMVFIKPTILGSNSNMTIVTNKHTYYFHLTSNKNTIVSSGARTYAIKFVYPSERHKQLLEKLKLQQQKVNSQLNFARNPSVYNWAYSFHGSKRIMPVHIFDDGKFTYMELRPNQVMPAVFAVDNKNGRESVVNFRRRGNYIVIQRIAPQYTLRAGKKKVASIFNDKMIGKLWGDHL